MDHATAPLSDWLHDCWNRLARGVADRHAAARHPVLATVGTDGAAKARTVVLRAASRSEGVLQIHTDTASSKVAEIAAAPGVTLLVWDTRAHLQIRAEAVVHPRSGSDAAQEWAKVPDGAAVVYGGSPPPGHPLADPAAHRSGPERERFCVLDCRVARFDLLYLGRQGHRRAEFLRDQGWEGRWIAP